MKPSILFVISSDPRESHRPAEAVRMAAGISAWKNVEVGVCLCGPAALVLGEEPEELVDGEHLARHLPLLSDAFLVLDGANPVAEPAYGSFACERVTNAELAALAADCNYILRF